MKYSLRSFLLFTILLSLIVIGGLSLLGGYRASVHEVEELFDAQLSRSARLIMALVLTETRLGHVKDFSESAQQSAPRLGNTLNHEADIEKALMDQGHFYELKLAYQVWDAFGNMVMRSANAPLYPMSQVQQGYDDVQVEQQRWRVFTLWDENRRYQVVTAESNEIRAELVEKITLQMSWPFVLMLPILGAVVWFFVGRALRPIDLIANEISLRQSESLAPLSAMTIPQEIQPLVGELNHLFDSLRNSFEKERRFTSDAAHELKTPLAALKVHMQLYDSSPDDTERRAALDAIHAGIERASHLVDQLLGLARLEPAAIVATQKKEELDLRQLCIDLLADVYPLAHKKQQQISLEAESAIYVSAYRYPLEMMLRNLLSNSVSHCSEKAEIILQLIQHSASVDIVLHDSGPGIPEAQREQVLGRFCKVQGQSGHNGCGIGLSIVKRVSDLHHMQIDLLSSERLGGLCVYLRWPQKSLNIDKKPAE